MDSLIALARTVASEFLRVSQISYLVGGLEHFLFSHIFGIIIPVDFHIFQRGRSTTNQLILELGIGQWLDDYSWA